MKRAFFTAILVTLAAGSIPALAQMPPTPSSKTEALEVIENRLEQERIEKQQLDRKLKSSAQELEGTKTQLVSLAAKIRKNVEKLEELEGNIEILDEEHGTIKARLEKDYGSIAELIVALERIRRIPPEALIVRPGAPLKTAQTAMLLNSTLPAVHERTEELSQDLDRLEELKSELEQDREEALTVSEDLEKRQKEMASLIEKRKSSYQALQSNIGEKEKAIRELSKEATNLKELMTKLEQERRRQASRMASQNYAGYIESVPKPGKAVLPVSGNVITSFGQQDGIGATSQGVTIESRPGSIVVAPLGGIVRFAETFKNYGKLVIIEHKNGYHSLVGGFGRTDVRAGQSINSGEPLGVLPLTSSLGGRPALYYELRNNGNPVNPSVLFSELKS